jgi:hypothetical protein
MPTPRLAVSVALVLSLLAATRAPAFDGNRATAGPLTVVIEHLPTVTERDQPQDVTVTLDNAAEARLAVRVELKGLVDECRVLGPARLDVSVPARGMASARFQVVFPEGCHSALYPLHVHAAFDHLGESLTAHAVEVVTTDFAAANSRPGPAAEAAAVAVPRHGGVALTDLTTQRVSWAYLGQPAEALPPGWHGREPRSFATFGLETVTRGEARPALAMHPPYRPRAGTIFAEYRLRLPAARPLRFTFFNAIRDNRQDEPPSDGVTFRVWVDDRKLFERHSDAKVWVPGEVDLDDFAGQEVRLRLESHPGPRGDTTCDSSYWGDPVVSAGPGPRTPGADEQAALLDRARAAVASGRAAGDQVFLVPLASGGRAALALGPNGLLDGGLAFGTADRQAAFAGLRAAVLGHPAGRWPSPLLTEAVTPARDGAGRLRVVHRLRLDDEPFDLTVTAWGDGDGLRLQVACPRRLTDLALGPADRPAGRVYFGHGYCVTDPGAFRVAGGGHGLSTGHVAFDFDGGPSLLLAADTPPDSLQVDPGQRLYALHTHPDTTFTFVPGTEGAFDCALRYRALDGRPAAPGVASKAGRFVFDLWGGRYAEIGALLRRAFAYGLTDALVVVHTWQRWGYDYRLPDVFPPDPRLGTPEDLQALGRLCADRGVPFALHDNYIDYYPDANDFSYGHITFDAAGRPRKAWLNEGRAAQSYQFRPDHILPFVRRNLGQIQPALRPTAYFLDVFTSMSPFDYYDRDGEFHSRTETLRCWGEAFDFIRGRLGGDAPTISEAGGDYLVGHVAGADCQFLQLSPRPGRFLLTVPCRDWERVPWLDLVHHDRFSLHGVGYSNRYEGGRGRAAHGIPSDDYLSAEVLTGHALMIDRPGLLRDAVRTYWLAQDVARLLARDRITAVTFAGGDLHREVISWESGLRVHVNRGASDWEVDGHVLPPFGYLARGGGVESSVERLGGVVVERERARGTVYVNGRGAGASAPEVDFGPVVTAGAVRCQTGDGRLTVTPLPDGPDFRLRLRPEGLLGRPVQVTAVEVMDAAGTVTRAVTFRADGGEVSFDVTAGDFAYSLRWR